MIPLTPRQKWITVESDDRDKAELEAWDELPDPGKNTEWFLSDTKEQKLGNGKTAYTFFFKTEVVPTIAFLILITFII